MADKKMRMKTYLGVRVPSFYVEGMESWIDPTLNPVSEYFIGVDHKANIREIIIKGDDRIYIDIAKICREDNLNIDDAIISCESDYSHFSDENIVTIIIGKKKLEKNLIYSSYLKNVELYNKCKPYFAEVMEAYNKMQEKISRDEKIKLFNKLKTELNL